MKNTLKIKSISPYSVVLNDIYISSIYSLYLALLFPDRKDIQEEILMIEQPYNALACALKYRNSIRRDFCQIASKIISLCSLVAIMQSSKKKNNVLSLGNAIVNIFSFKKMNSTLSDNIIFLHDCIENDRVRYKFILKYLLFKSIPKIPNLVLLGKEINSIHEVEYFLRESF